MQAFCKELSFLPKESHEMLQGCPALPPGSPTFMAWDSTFFLDKIICFPHFDHYNNELSEVCEFC